METKICSKCGEAVDAFAIGRQCKVCRAAYQRAYRETHREQAQDYHRRYWAANKERLSAYRRQWRRDNQAELKAKARARQRAWREANKDKVKAWREANPEKMKEYNRRYYLKQKARRDREKE